MAKFGTFKYSANKYGDNKINQTSTHIWNSLNTINQTSTHKWNLLGIIQQTLTLKWTLLAVINQTSTHIWNLLSKIGRWTKRSKPSTSWTERTTDP